MVSKATTCLLIALTLISPSACCCSVEAAADWIFTGIVEPSGIAQPASCCHRIAGSPVSYADSQLCSQQANHQGTSGHCNSSNTGSGDDSHDCPCREDGSKSNGVPSTLDLASAPLIPALSALLHLHVVPTVLTLSGGEGLATLNYLLPRGYCENGQGILRAYGRLRI